MINATTMPSAANAASAAPALGIPRVPATARPLTSAHTVEVLDFLAARPVHTVNLASLMRDNGLVNPLNRGTFYGCRDEQGRLEGVALIGHATLVEARTARALAAFAQVAQQCSDTHMIMGEQEHVASFWQQYSGAGQERRLACRELLFELRYPVAVQESIAGLRPATLADLDLIAPVQAEMAHAESGVNPLERDPEGFRRRCARRIEQGRTWVLVADDRLVFKAELQGETDEVIYLEGIYVAPAARAQGYGQRCLSQLARTLLTRVRALCLLSNEQFREAHALYRKVGFKCEGIYDTIFLSSRSN
jgi:predicted GNAT family acetyltransferase